jgi:predicted TIM-barrel fold metal-dependent hydrolase
MRDNIDAFDSHVHLWTDDFQTYPLATGFKPTDMAVPRFTPEDLLEQMQANGVGRAVLVQMNCYGTDNSLILDAIRFYPDRFRGIAVVDENWPDLAQIVRNLAQSGVGGLRVNVLESGGNRIRNSGMKSLFTIAEREHLALSFLTEPEMLPEIDGLCSRFPGTRVVIDHMARIGMNRPADPSDVNALCKLARHTQTAVKVSAFYALGAKMPPHDDLEPIVRQLHDSFGPTRLMWGSDSPFQIFSGTYSDSIEFVRRRLQFLTADDKEWLLRRTAEEFYLG